MSDETLPRPFGDYLLVAQLGDDPLGSVYRAIHSADEKRFVRLRILRSGELTPPAVIAAVEKNAALGPALAHEGIVRRPQFGVWNGVPYMAWYETAGWTLDRVLAAARAEKSPIKTDYALLLAERIIDAMEGATRGLEADGVSAVHGVLWPGFVSISNDAEVRIAGFGLAPAVLPELVKPRVLREVAPYVAPEARETLDPGPRSDVYSIGVILLELLTGRRPALGSPLPELRAGDPFSREIGVFLRLALASPEERYSTIPEMRLALRETLMAAPRTLYPAGLAFFLYRLLNPEINGIAPADADQTVPVITETEVLLESETAGNPMPREQTFEENVAAADPPAQSEPAAPGDWGLFSPVSPPLHFIRSVAAFLGGRPDWASGPGALLVLAGIVFGLALLIDSRHPGRTPQARAPIRAQAQIAALTPAIPGPPRDDAAPGDSARSSSAPVLLAKGRAAIGSAKTASLGRAETLPPLRTGVARASNRSRRREEESVRRQTEDLRLQAGLARVAAERLDGAEIASGPYREASEREKEGEQLFRERHYQDARAAFGEAARLFREAESASREERTRRIQLSPAP